MSIQPRMFPLPAWFTLGKHRPDDRQPVAPMLSGGDSVLFAAQRKAETKTYHRSDAEEDDYSRYTPGNTVAPPALYHTLIAPDAQHEFRKLSDTLEQYISGNGDRYLDIPWVKYQYALGKARFSIFDLETTGLERYERILQIGVAPIKPDLTVDYARTLDTLVHPGFVQGGQMFEINPAASRVHGITAEHVMDKPEMNELLPRLRGGDGVLKERELLVAYNAKFDAGMMNEAIDRWNKSAHRKEKSYLRPIDRALVIDPFVLIQRIHPFVSLKKTLGNHYRILMGCELENKHDAQADVGATLDVLKYVFKYLQKHSIPLSWAHVAEKALEKKAPAEWAALDNTRKTAAIAQLVREYRPAFEAKFGPADTPLKMIDILRFQHGGIPAHQENGQKTYWPVLDILSLNSLGFDGDKKWDGTDTLDAAVVEEVRRERDQENRLFLQQALNERLRGSPELGNLLEIIRTALQPAMTDAKKTAGYEKRLAQELIAQLSLPMFAEKVLAKTLPDFTVAGNEQAGAIAAYKNELTHVINTWLTGKTQGKNLTEEQRAALVSALAEEVINQVKNVRQDLDKRWFYGYTPVSDPQALIDPAVRKSVLKANRSPGGLEPRFAGSQPSVRPNELRLKLLA